MESALDRAARPDPLAAALDQLVSEQRKDGAWEGEMVWNTMILAQYVVVRAICGRPVDDKTRAGFIRHFEAARRADGSWGMHPASEGYLFFTALAYIALRLLGLSSDHPLCAGARRWLRAPPGASSGSPSSIYIPTKGSILAPQSCCCFRPCSPSIPIATIATRETSIRQSRIYGVAASAARSAPSVKRSATSCGAAVTMQSTLRVTGT